MEVPSGGGNMTGLWFESPWLLLLALLGPLYWFLRKRWLEGERRRLRRFVRPALWKKVDVSPPPSRAVSRTLWSVGLLLCGIALSGPVWGLEEALVPSGGRNLVVALDVSASMACRDEVPTRLRRAVAELSRLRSELPDVRMSLVLFSDRARLAVPLTTDERFFVERLPGTPWAVSDLRLGTRLGSLVDVMAAALPERGLEARLGLLLSDGGFHDFSVQSSAQRARDAGLRLLTVGLGGDDPVPVPDRNGGPLTTAGGDTVRTALEDEQLKALAEQTDGFYTRLSDVDDLASLVNDMLSPLETAEEMPEEAAAPARRYQYFLGAALLCFLVGVVLERRRL
ncbi:VWA domain-containing protein [Candidatus Fermentibacteria bacterium]|nr:VWA domain-containing protein [Candidatus Fermentibacteria bacterium]